MGTRNQVAELDIARKAMREALKQDIATAKRQIAPGALIGQLKQRTKGQVTRKAQDAKHMVAGNRKSLALGGLLALSASLIAYSTKRWKRRHPKATVTVPAVDYPILMENEHERTE